MEKAIVNTITTKKVASGLHAVFVNGQKTHLFIGKGDPPKYRMPQLWSIGAELVEGESPCWIANDLTSKHEAEAAIRIILNAVSK